MVPTIKRGDPEPSEARRGEENSARVSALSCESHGARSASWYKSYRWNSGPDSREHLHFIINDLLGERIPITEQQYDDDNFTSPN